MVYWFRIFCALCLLILVAVGANIHLHRGTVLDCEKLVIKQKKYYKGKVFRLEEVLNFKKTELKKQIPKEENKTFGTFYMKTNR